MKPTIGLVMLVKNEEEGIERCLRGAMPFIDTWTIVDTGSTDGTKAKIEQVLAEMAGSLHDRDWVNFGHNRSELLALAKDTADYLLMLDADMVIHMPLHADLIYDCYQGRILGSSLDYTLPLLVRGNMDWYYEGVAHSYLACRNGLYTEDELPGLAVDDYSTTGPGRLERNLELLSAEHARKPLDARTAFYLAETYKDLDRFDEAIAAYRYRSHLDGWEEETYYAKYMLGVLLCEHVSFNEGCKVLMDAWNFRPSRIEPLRVIANVANDIADRAPYPIGDKLFVHKAKYLHPPPRGGEIIAAITPPRPPLVAGKRPRVAKIQGALSPKSVSAIFVTRGNVDMDEVTAPAREAGIEDIVIWDNSKLPIDYKVFGRYAAIPLTRNPVLHWVDDDVIFTNYADLFAAYEPGKLVGNMDQEWIDGARYGDFLCMVGAGSLCPAALPDKVFKRYLHHHPFNDDVLVECDFAFGVLAPFKRVDLGYAVRPFTDDADRLYQQPGQTERKWAMIERARALLNG